ncbi:MAG: anion transporter, partial [Hyphomicrobiales bacterium]|nr:anion transporter [Hyphomicrobiales bacterium]
MALAIFAATYLVMAIGKLPGYQLDRAGAALLGASLMVWLGVLSLEEAFQSIDLETIVLLLGMMIVVANLRLSGFFGIVNNWVVARARHPLALLCGVILMSGILSAFLVNDAICLVLTLPVLDIARRLGRDPTPYLLAIPMASNAGSVATITGNPQNMIIGSIAKIPYGIFAAKLFPVAAVALVLTTLIIAIFYPGEFFNRGRLIPAVRQRPLHYHRGLAIKSVAVTIAMVAFFFAGEPVAKVAILGGALLLFTRRVKPEKVYLDIDWPLLVMFIGLFIVVAGAEKSLLDQHALSAVGLFDLRNTAVLSVLTAVLSNLVSNVPAVLVMKPFVTSLADQQRAWLVIAMASTLAGNFTLVGSVANLIVAQRARSRDFEIGFWNYFKVGAPLTALSIA